MIKVGPRIAGSWDWSRDHLHRWWLAGLHTLEPPCRWWGDIPLRKLRCFAVFLFRLRGHATPYWKWAKEALWGKPRCSFSITTVSKSYCPKCSYFLQTLKKSVSLEVTLMKPLWRSLPITTTLSSPPICSLSHPLPIYCWLRHPRMDKWQDQGFTRGSSSVEVNPFFR